jgi:iron(III) transport system permease protein
MSYGALKSKVKGGRITELFSSIPLAFPGIVYGVALFWTFLMLPGISGLIYGTIFPLVIALTFVRLPYSIRMISGGLMQISKELEEAARLSGASWFKNFRQIVLPLLKNSLVNSFIYTFINSIRELGGVILLITPGSIVLTVLLLNYYSAHAGALNTIAAASVFLSIIIMLLLAIPTIIQRYSEYKSKKTPMTIPPVDDLSLKNGDKK